MTNGGIQYVGSGTGYEGSSFAQVGKRQPVEVVDQQIGRAERARRIGVGDGDRAEAGGPRRLEAPMRVLDRDTFGRGESLAAGGRQAIDGAQVRVGCRFAGGAVFGGDDGAEALRSVRRG